MTSMRPTVDVGPAAVTGALRVQRVRVMWEAGVLYVVRSLQDVSSLVCPQQPRLARGPHQPFHAETDAGLVKFRQAGCRCSYSLGDRNGFALMDIAKPYGVPQNG